ncbi:glutathione synthase [Wenzhouxiangella sediminis]|uniref:Glutathione synthetase n=1 Tax=Wenzhouxiangella sediminis TaxID=1792836 RepID=A0A3E1KCE8_9GAMM|nr:glutathione synthase [Wenzhouxiangella sediminis]RFF32504.1 glutathione synthase [Wenzhouxiangella sediminis]
MRKNLVVVMDDISEIKVVKDTSLAMLLEGQRRGYRLWYLGDTDLYLEGSRTCARMRAVRVEDDPEDWYELGEPVDRPLGEDDLVLMRADPPVDNDYLMATYLLEQAENAGAKVVNRPRALRDFNEKLAIARFPELIPETLVSSDAAALRAFVQRTGKAVLKPLDGMGGKSIFLLERDDRNLNVVIETLTDSGARLAMAQEYLPAISEGDKRVLIVHGRPVDKLLARIPGKDDFRGNLARGGRGEGRPLEAADRRIAETVGPVLLEHGIEFAGLDIIGDRLTEINVTSPTCVRELDAQFGINIISDLFDAIDP